MKKFGIIGLVIVVIFSVILLLNRNNIAFSPWVTTEPVSYATYASGNDERLSIISNSEKAITVLDWKKQLIYKL